MIEIDTNERIVKVVRKHWFVLLRDLFLLIVLVALPIIFLIAGHLLPIEKFVSFPGSTVYAGAFFLFTWLFVVWMVAWDIWTDYYLDVLIITDKRIFDIEQKGLFSRTSSSFRIDRIQNITVGQKGIVQTLLDFGTMQLETAGDGENFIAPFIANPYEIKKFINEMLDAEARKGPLN